MPKKKTQRKKIAQHFSRAALARICEMPERSFAAAYGMETVKVRPARKPFQEYDFYHFLDRGADVLAVAHLDTVADAHERRARFLDYAGGTVVYSRALDDRLGAYVILDLLPKLGVNVDVLLATGEEVGQSTAFHFNPPEGKDYHWIVEFDRAGNDVVLYEYEDTLTRELVREAGARVGIGSFSDISEMEHLGVKAFNWGIGYQDAHGNRAHAYLNDTFDMVAKYLDFHAANEGEKLEHVESEWVWTGGGGWRDSSEDTNDPPVTIIGHAAEEEDWQWIDCDGCNDPCEPSELRRVEIPGTGRMDFFFCPSCLDWARDEGWITDSHPADAA